MTSLALTRSAGRRAQLRFAWIYGPVPDLAIALCWVPFFVVAHALSVRHGVRNDHLLSTLFDGAFVFSLMHQPLTLALVYGNRSRFASRRGLFVWSPLIGVPLIALAVMLNLWVIVPVAAVWNTIHTLQQRYGLSRIYGRKAGEASGRLDRALLYGWMALALVIVGSAGSVLHQLARVMLDDTNTKGIAALSSVRPYALWLLGPVAIGVAALTAATVRREMRNREHANAAKWVYQISSVVLIASIAFDPMAGFIAYVAAHAIEYAVVVQQTMGKDLRARQPEKQRTGLKGAVVVCAVAGAFYVTTRLLSGRSYDIVVYSIGILHFWYDGFIWKLRKPAIAAQFDLVAAPPAA